MPSNSPYDNDIAQLKRELRAQIIAQRDALVPALRSRKSSAICANLADAAKQALPTRMSRQPIVAVYSPMESEVDLGEFIAALYDMQARVAFPATLPNLQDGQRMQMRIVSYKDYLDGAAPFIAHPVRPFSPVGNAENGRYPAVAPHELDAIVVPLVGFDANGMRLGYGGGCYDRYLPKLQPRCFVVGVAFSEQQVPHVPVDTFDLPLPRIISA